MGAYYSPSDLGICGDGRISNSNNAQPPPAQDTVTDEMLNLFRDLLRGELITGGETYGTQYRTQIERFLDPHDPVPERRTIAINFNDIIHVNAAALPILLLRTPSTVLPQLDAVFREVVRDLLSNEYVNYIGAHRFRVRIHNVRQAPLGIRDLRSESIKHLIETRGVITKTTGVKPMVTEAVFQCLNCSQANNITLIRIPQEEIGKYRPPSRCTNPSCHGTPRFRFRDDLSIFLDYQEIRIQENPEDVAGGDMPRTIPVIVTDEQAGILVPGDRCTITGILRMTPDFPIFKYFDDVPSFSKYIECVHIEIESGEVALTITDEDVDRIHHFVEQEVENGTIYTTCIKSVAPSLYGIDNIKECCLFALFGGVRLVMDSTIERGDSHILLIGDPATAKGALLTFLRNIIPRGMYTSGEGTSAAGLLAAVTQKKTGAWILEAGVLVLCDQGVALIDEMDKMNPNDRKKLHTAMEQQVFCYDDQTEILTEDGWKFFKDLTDNDIVATLNPQTDSLEYAKPSLIFQKPYKGKMVQVEGSRKVDLVVTPDHKMYVSINKRANEWSDFNLVKVEDVVNKKVKYKRNCKWIGVEKDFFEIPPIEIHHNQHTSHTEPPIKIPMDVWLEFFGYWLAEGYASKYTTTITQSANEEKQNKIKSIFDKMPFKYAYYCDTDFSIRNKQLSSYLMRFGKAHQKCIPPGLKDLSPRQLKILLEAMMVGDGCSLENKTRWYLTTSSRLADDVQELLLKTGISGNIRVQTVESLLKYDRSINGRKVHPRHNQQYTISFVLRNTPQVGYNPKQGRNAANHKMIDYDGIVYCVEVPSHIVYVRRNGVPVWSGNTIAKAGIVTSLNSRTTIIAAANPKWGRYNPNKTYMENINLPPTIVSRFDMIFLLKDDPNVERDGHIARHILKRGKSPAITSTPVEATFFKKYIYFARKNCHPVLTDKADARAEEWYVHTRKVFKDHELPQVVTPRQLQAIKRLAIARAKIRLARTATIDDVNYVIGMYNRFLKEIAVDPETGEIDIDLFNTGASRSQKETTERIFQLIKHLKRSMKLPLVPFDIILENLKNQTPNTDPEKVKTRLTHHIQILKGEGRAGQPRIIEPEKDGRYKIIE